MRIWNETMTCSTYLILPKSCTVHACCDNWPEMSQGAPWLDRWPYIQSIFELILLSQQLLDLMRVEFLQTFRWQLEDLYHWEHSRAHFCSHFLFERWPSWWPCHKYHNFWHNCSACTFWLEWSQTHDSESRSWLTVLRETILKFYLILTTGLFEHSPPSAQKRQCWWLSRHKSSTFAARWHVLQLSAQYFDISRLLLHSPSFAHSGHLGWLSSHFTWPIEETVDDDSAQETGQCFSIYSYYRVEVRNKKGRRLTCSSPSLGKMYRSCSPCFECTRLPPSKRDIVRACHRSHLLHTLGLLPCRRSAGGFQTPSLLSSWDKLQFQGATGALPVLSSSLHLILVEWIFQQLGYELRRQVPLGQTKPQTAPSTRKYLGIIFLESVFGTKCWRITKL